MSTNIANTKRKAAPLAVPTINDDPSERKRVLNVLAQRRYRRRKKEQMQALEKEVRQNSNSSHLEDFTCNLDTQSLASLNGLGSRPMRASQNTETSAEEYNFDFSPDDIFPQIQSSEMTCLDSSMFEAVYPMTSNELPSLLSTPSVITTDYTSQDKSLSYWDGKSTTQTSDFPDERHLPMLELNLLRAAMSIAQRLKVDSEIWSLEALSPFHNSSPTMYLHLPANLRPTTLQLTTPHHPVFDILPWPSVREKLIMVFMQPIDMRPPIARTATALIDFVYDLEDAAEGVRVWGGDPHSDKNWEVGKKLFLNWWWALDSEVISRSNDLRRQRGATLLVSDRDRIIEELE